VNIPDGDGAVQPGPPHCRRVVDGDHLGRAWGDVVDPDFGGRDLQQAGEVGPQDLGRDLPGWLDGDDQFAERGIAALDQADDDRAGRGDERPGRGMIVDVLGDGGVVELADGAELVDVVETDPAEGEEDRVGEGRVVELAVEDRRRDGDLVAEHLQVRERGRPGLDRFPRAEAEAFPAVDAELVDDAGLPAGDADGPGRAGRHAVDTADAFRGVDVQGVAGRLLHGSLPFARIVISRRVPCPTLEVILSRLVFFLMLGSPIPAPNPSSCISGVAVE
jgi:hypothetical protein